MSPGQTLIILGVAAVVLVAVGVLRRRGVPAPVVLVVAGLVIGFVPFVPDVSLSPRLALLGLLPLLVFEAAVTSSPSAFRREAQSIGALAVLLVIATAGGVAVVAHVLGGLSWPMAFVLGTAIGPTDAAAATSIARHLSLPRRIVTLLEGEALFNDATALVLYAAAVGAATSGQFSVEHTGVMIGYSVVVGAGIGVAIGVAGHWLRSRIDDAPVEIAGSILLAYAAYLPAEAIHASGVLAAVSAGLYLGRHSSGTAVSATVRLQSAAFWETLGFGVNAALFILVGLSFHTFTGHAHGAVAKLAVTGAGVVLVVVAIRLAWMSAFGAIGRRLRRHDDSSQPGWHERLVLGWGGMRGAITLAALLAVPQTTASGRALAGRDDTIYLGFVVILATLLGQGLTLPALVRRLSLREHPTVVDAPRQARVVLAQAALEHLARAGEVAAYPTAAVDELQVRHAARLRTLAPGPPHHDVPETSDLTLRRELVEVQRAALARLRRDGVVGTTTARVLERELDLEDSRLSIRRPPHRLHLAPIGSPPSRD